MVSRCQGHDVDLMIVVPRQLERNGEPSHARERRWPVGFEINVNSRRPVMRVVRLQRQKADHDHRNTTRGI